MIVSWEITCVIFNLGGTKACVPFFDALDVELGTLSSAEKAFVRVEKDGTHVSNLDLRQLSVWSTQEVQIQSVSQSVKKTGLFCVASHAIKHPASAVSKIIVSGGATRAIEHPATAAAKWKRVMTTMKSKKSATLGHS